MPEYDALRREHELFHVRAAEVMVLAAAGVAAQARRALAGDGALAHSSSRVVLAIGALRRAIDAVRAGDADTAQTQSRGTRNSS